MNKYAVVVGVSTYQEPGFSALPLACNDAVRIAAVLERYCGFQQEGIYLLTWKPPDSSTLQAHSPTRSEILKRLKYISETAKPDDLVVFFFAGHGMEISGRPYLLATDTVLNVIDHTAVNLDDVNSMLKKSNASCVVRFFDACRTPFAEGRGFETRMSDGFQRAVLAKCKGWATLSACSSGEVAYDSVEFEQGVFSYFLCEGLEGKGANRDQQVTIESLADYVKHSVTNWCTTQSLMQTPNLQSDLSGSLTFNAVQPVPVEHRTSDLPGPFDTLKQGLQNHWSTTRADARNLKFTSSSQFKEVCAAVLDRLVVVFDGFSVPKLNVALSEPLSHLDGNVMTNIQEVMSHHQVGGEFNALSARRAEYCSSEAIIPGADLIVAVIKFSFFYWCYFYFRCLPGANMKGFTPDPPAVSGFFTFWPTSAKDPLKVERVLNEILERSHRTHLKWSDQLRNYLEARLDPIRKLGDIIG